MLRCCDSRLSTSEPEIRIFDRRSRFVIVSKEQVCRSAGKIVLIICSHMMKHPSACKPYHLNYFHLGLDAEVIQEGCQVLLHLD